jgi:hypothetical protein
MDTVTTCSCGRKYSAADLRKLPLLGLMPDGDGGVLELRDCQCGSTLSLPAPVAGPERAPTALATALLAAFHELPGPALPLRPLAKTQPCMPLGVYSLREVAS